MGRAAEGRGAVGERGKRHGKPFALRENPHPSAGVPYRPSVPVPRCPAVFLDRDGTIIEDPGFLHDPDRVRLLLGAAAAVGRLNRAGFLVVVASNQSGVACGLYPISACHAVEERLNALLAREGARIDAHYLCPHHPDYTGPCECRKPGVRLFREAAERFDIDLARSWWVGDRLRDVQPASAFGGRGLLVLTGAGATEAELTEARAVTVVQDVGAAAEVIVNQVNSKQ